MLVGCRATGINSNSSASEGTIVPNYVVIGGRAMRYEKIHGLRSEIPGLALWAGKESVTTRRHRDDEGRISRVDFRVQSEPEVRLAPAKNLKLRPTWRVAPRNRDGIVSVHDLVELETTVQRPAPWSEHLAGHFAIRELLVVSAWQRLGFTRLWANRQDDPERTLSGDIVQPRWAESVTYRVPQHDSAAGNPRFLFTFDDVGAAGVHRWLRLRRRYERAVQPLIGLMDQRHTFMNAQFVQSGIALEALGYQLAVDAGGKALNRHGEMPYPRGLELILDDMPYIPVTNPKEWASRSQSCYKGVKHPDNPTPDSLEVVNTYRENLLVLRCWIAGRLGVSAETLAGRLPLDPLSRTYEYAD